MKTPSLKIEKVRLKALYDYAAHVRESPVYKDAMPISPARALSQANNPYGDPDDIVLLAAHLAGKCAAYIGLLPGLLKNGQQLSKVFFSTTLYVLPELRGRGIGDRLLTEVKKLNVDIIFTGISKSAKAVHDRVMFHTLGQLTYYQLLVDRLFDSDSHLKQFKRAALDSNAGAGPAEAMIQAIKHQNAAQFKRVFYPAVMAAAVPAALLDCRTVDRIGQKFSPAAPTAPEFHRGLEAVNWMLQYPWITSSVKKNMRDENYYFTSARPLFKYLAFECCAPGDTEPEGYFVLSVSMHRSRTSVKLLDIYMKNPANLDVAGFISIDAARQYSADRIDFPQSLADYFLRQPLLTPLIKKRRRLYELQPKKGDSPVLLIKDKIRLNYCDADIAFT